jgi:hypothetical protein
VFESMLSETLVGSAGRPPLVGHANYLKGGTGKARIAYPDARAPSLRPPAGA